MILKPFDSTESKVYQYTAIDERNVYKSLYSDGVMAMICKSRNYISAKDVIGNSFLCTTTGSNVEVNAGCAMIGGLHIYQSEKTVFEISVNESGSEIVYNVIISADLSAQQVEVKLAKNDELPSKYLLLATFTVKNGTNSVSNLTDKRTPVSTIAYCESANIINNLVESGTWTPELYVVQGGTMKVNSKISLSAKYYKIGKLMYINLVLTNGMITFSKNSGSSGVEFGIRGLPYSVNWSSLSIGKTTNLFIYGLSSALAGGKSIRFYTNSTSKAYGRTFEGDTIQELYLSGVCYISE